MAALTGRRILHLSAASVDTRYFKTLVPPLAERGLEVYCGTLHSSSEPAWIAATDRVNHFTLNSRAGPGFHWMGAAVRLGRLLRQKRIDVVQTHLFEPGTVGALAARLARCPVIVTRHHTDEMRIVGTRAHVGMDRAAGLLATRMLGFSEAVREHLVQEEGVARDKVDVIYQGFNFDEFVPSPDEVATVRAEFGLEGRFVIGDVARFFPTKRQVDLLRAGRLLADQVDGLSVLLVGGGDRSKLEELADAEGMGDRTVVTGHRSDVPACFGAMDVVVHPSLTEAFCQVLIEALGAGRPLVATDVASASEIIDDGRTGLLVPPRAPEALAEAVERLYLDDDLRAGLGTAGQQAVRTRFPVSAMVNAQLALYESILGRNPRLPLSGHRAVEEVPVPRGLREDR